MEMSKIEIEKVGFDENDMLIIDCIAYPDENYLKARFVSDKAGNLLYGEKIVFDEETKEPYSEGCALTFTYEK